MKLTSDDRKLNRAKEQTPYRELGQYIGLLLKSKSITQYALAQSLEVEKQSVWNWVNGRKRPSLVNLSRIAKELQADSVELASLANFTAEETGMYFMLIDSVESSLNGAEHLDDLEQNLSAARHFYQLGDPQFAMMWADRLEQKIVVRTAVEYGKRLRDFQHLLARCLVLHMESAISMARPHDALTAINPAYQKVMKISKAIHDDSLMVSANTWYGDALYVDTKYAEAALKLDPIIDDESRSKSRSALRTHMLAHANNGNRQRFEETEAIALDEIDRGVFADSSDAAELYESMGRSRAILGLPLVDMRFAFARVMALPMRLRRVQVARSELIALTHQKSPDLVRAVQVTREGLRDAAEYFPRHAKEIGFLAFKLKINDQIEE